MGVVRSLGRATADACVILSCPRTDVRTGMAEQLIDCLREAGGTPVGARCQPCLAPTDRAVRLTPGHGPARQILPGHNEEAPALMHW